MAKKLLIIWTGVNILYAGSGAAATILSIVLRMMDNSNETGPHFLRSLIISKITLDGVLALGVMVLASWLISLWGIFTGLQKGDRPNIGTLVIFNWTLLICGVTTIVVGSAIWFVTLTPRSAFSKVWIAQSPERQQFLQDSLQCCGYFNATTAGLLSASEGFCAQLSSNTNTTLIQGCMTPINDAADFNLNNLFSGIFGFAAVQSALFILTCAVIQWRKEVCRFIRIDTKRGSGNSVIL